MSKPSGSLEFHEYPVLDDGGFFIPYGEFPHPMGLQIVDRESATMMASDLNGFLGKMQQLSDRVRVRTGASNGTREFRLAAPCYKGHTDDRSSKDYGKDNDSYGWCTGIIPQETGFKIAMEWSEDGLNVIRQKKLIFPSPFWDMLPVKGRPGAYRPFHLRSVGLTNNPNIPVAPMANEKVQADMIEQWTSGGVSKEDIDFVSKQLGFTVTAPNDANFDSAHLIEPVKSTTNDMKISPKLKATLGMSEIPDDDLQDGKKIDSAVQTLHEQHSGLVNAHAKLAAKNDYDESMSNARKVAIKAHAANVGEAAMKLHGHVMDAMNSAPGDMPKHLQAILGMCQHMANAAPMIGGLAEDAPHGQAMDTFYAAPPPLTAGSGANEKTTESISNETRQFRTTRIAGLMDALVKENKVLPCDRVAQEARILSAANAASEPDSIITAEFETLGKKEPLKTKSEIPDNLAQARKELRMANDRQIALASELDAEEKKCKAEGLPDNQIKATAYARVMRRREEAKQAAAA